MYLLHQVLVLYSSTDLHHVWNTPFCYTLTSVLQEGHTVLHASCLKGNVGMVKFILEHFNPNLEARNEVC